MARGNPDFVKCKELLDKFCYPIEKKYIGREILIFKKLKSIISIDLLLKIDLKFKIHSLAWFLTVGGKDFLNKRKKIVSLQQEIATERKNSVKETPCNNQRFGVDYKIKKQKSLMEIIDG